MAWICEAAEAIEVVSGVIVPVACAGHLLAQKLLSRGSDRLQDDIDIRSIMAGLDSGEKERCRQALTAVVALGANRGKDLLSEFEALTK